MLFGLKIIPTLFTILFGMKMTIGPGTLLLHRLKCFEVFQTHEFLQTRINQPNLSLNAYQMVKIPFVSNFLVSFTFPCYALLFLILTLFTKSVTTYPDIGNIVIYLLFIGLSGIRAIFGSKNKIMIGFNNIILLVGMVLCIMNYSFIETRKNCLLITLYCCYLVITPVANAQCYFKYSCPYAELLSNQCFHVTLRQLYSPFVNLIIFINHHFDIIVVASYFVLENALEEETFNYVFTGMIILSSIFSFISLPFLIQSQILYLLLPYYVSKNEKNQKLSKLFQPLGAIVYGLSVSPLSQIIIAFSYLHFKLVGINYDAFKTFMLFGAIINCSSRFFSLIFQFFF